MKQIHRITGIIVSIFIVAHLFNHCMAYYGIETHQAILESFRKVYRIPVIEFLLVAAFVFQGVTGIQLFLKLRKKGQRTSLEKLKMYSGLVLGLFILQHIGATIGMRWYYEFDTNFYFAARVAIQEPFLYYFIPYYFAGIMAFAVHIAAVHRGKITRFVSIQQATIHFYGILFFFFLVAALILFTFTGGFYEIEIPSQYNVY